MFNFVNDQVKKCSYVIAVLFNLNQNIHMSLESLSKCSGCQSLVVRVLKLLHNRKFLTLYLIFDRVHNYFRLVGFKMHSYVKKKKFKCVC